MRHPDELDLDVRYAGLTADQAIDAIESNLWSMWSAFGRGEGCRLVDEAGLTRFETPLAQVPYNCVIRFEVDESLDAVIDDVIDDVLGAYQRRDVPLVWFLHPTSRPSDLADRLAARGLVEAQVIPGMVARLDGLPPADPIADGIALYSTPNTLHL
ncbi:MAG: hypothetical protein ACRDZZ_04825 [Ilumatobacteraceae bacterium]